MSQNQDHDFRSLLADYAAPVADDGFTQTVLRRSAKIKGRRPIIAPLIAAVLGLLAGTIWAQFVSLDHIWARISKTSLPDVSGTLGLSSYALIPVLVLVLWLIIDPDVLA